MRIFNVQPASRPVPVDRSAANKIGQFETGATAPHAQTSRWSYTVAAGKKAIREGGVMSVRRVTAAAPVGMVTVNIQYTPISTGVAATVAILQLSTNNVLDHAEVHVPNNQDMLAGDILQGLTQDEGTGGTVSYKVNAPVFEYAS